MSTAQQANSRKQGDNEATPHKHVPIGPGELWGGQDVTFVSPKGENHLFSDAAWRGGVATQFLAFIDKNVKNAK